NVNETPTDIALSNSTVAENQPIGTTVGTFSTTDPDTGNTFTYSLVPGTGGTNNGLFSITGNTLTTAASFDYELKLPYSIRVKSADAGGLFTEKAFAITITDENDSPTDIALIVNAIAENQPIGWAVGVLSAADPDSGDTFTYALVSGAGSADNAQFTITGST